MFSPFWVSWIYIPTNGLPERPLLMLNEIFKLEFNWDRPSYYKSRTSANRRIHSYSKISVRVRTRYSRENPFPRLSPTCCVFFFFVFYLFCIFVCFFFIIFSFSLLSLFKLEVRHFDGYFVNASLMRVQATENLGQMLGCYNLQFAHVITELRVFNSELSIFSPKLDVLFLTFYVFVV